ncbi:hypothetical protein HOR13_gp45 [Xanthomonas phage XAJ24]|uniref:Uncharacterized protein n=1 Tax=Xanthomonas phage XAJ24 TaxID=1775250 RepID=A0A1I9L288_9CAUD|nr:hypothetical protein HOR13_gp45 [Xanthomonas phage XAJ24]AMW36075.1 hypothetical protein [Xanthomonas phage XAJ24]
MRKILIRILILWYWIIGRGPWIVVGQYHDDDGVMRRFRTGNPSSVYWGYRRKFDSLDEANRYCESRNSEACTDPLGTTYYVWHELEFKHFHMKEKY